MVVRIGTSGWSYDHWTGVLYPSGTRPQDRLAIYTREFDTVELNASFYRWPTDRGFASWNRRLPEWFQLSVKAPRGLTHAKRLYSPEPWLQRISGSWHQLRDRRGVLLLQLPPSLARDDVRLSWFLERVPPWMRVAVELRNPSWHEEAIFSLLERHSAAYCVMSGAHLPCILRTTASFVYVRLHGPDQGWLYAGSYSDDDLRWWAERIREWDRGGRDVYAYFNNDGNGFAVNNARQLKALLQEP